jgi:hypothetical protein
MKVIMILLFLAVNAEDSKPKTKVERLTIDYKGKTVKAKKLTVSSEIPMEIDVAWNNVKAPELLRFVAKGMIGFKSIDGGFPKNWEVGQTYGVKMRIFGFIPFGGVHYLFIERIDDECKVIATKEWDKEAKVWNHNIMMKDLGNGNIYYEDAIIIYGGWKTGIITSFAKRFYKHRQKRWQIVAKEKFIFGQ